jgi:hypothetical protein
MSTPTNYHQTDGSSIASLVLASAALVLAILSIVIIPIGLALVPFISIPAIIYAHLFKIRIRQSSLPSKNGFSTSGLIIGYISLAISGLGLLLFFGPPLN